MSIRSVSREVRSALRDQSVSGSEAKSIVAEAEKGRVTTGESKQLVDVWNQANSWSLAGPMGHLNSPRVHMDNEARNTFNAYFAAHSVPAGENFAGVKQQILNTLENTPRGEALDCEPNLKNLHPVFLGDSRPVDGEALSAFLNTEKKEFYLQSTGAGMAGPEHVGPFFYGPFKLDDSKLEAGDIKKMLQGDTGRARRLGDFAFGRLTRSDAINIDNVTERKDGLFDVDLSKHHFMTPGPGEPARVVVDGNGALQADVVPSVKGETLKAMQDTFSAHADSLSYSRTGMPAGGRMHRVQLATSMGVGGDNYSYAAMVPVGALAPGADVSDPNKATEIYIQRSGGLAGLTEYAGPIKLGSTPGSAADKMKALIEGDVAKLQELGQEVFGHLALSRSHSVDIQGVTERADGCFDVHLGLRHWQSSDLQDDGRIVVDPQGNMRPDFAPELTPENMAKVMAAFTAAKDSLQFAVDGLPMGPRFNRELLEKQPGFDTYTYTALIGTGAVHPGAKATDPNKATSFFVERSGGFAGMTEYAGPVSLAGDPTQG
jgi:hypothetical protein